MPLLVILNFRLFLGVDEQCAYARLHGNDVVMLWDTDRAKEILPESRKHILRHAFGVIEPLSSLGPRALSSF
jgi:hypothetical protein